jgi:glucokinase
MIALLEPEAIVIGGGAAALFEPLLEDIRERWRGACINPCPLSIPLLIARYGEEAGVAGAAALCA